jgi:hypothetical protein
MNEFNTIFDWLYNQILINFCPIAASVHLLYMNSFEGKFCFILKDKNPT